MQYKCLWSVLPATGVKLLQHSDSVVFPEGLNSKPKTLQFSFQELPLWNATTADGPA